MASETITLTTICAGGNHLVFTGTGAKAVTVEAMLSEMSEALTDDDMKSFVKVIVKLAKIGRTNAQARTLLQAGVTVIV